MKEAQAISIAQAMDEYDLFDTVIDARSPSEFALDHLPGAINLPVLDDDERALVGTVNAAESAFAAKRLGAAKVSARISAILAGPLADKPHDWKPLVYCWRGGNRSGSLATVLARVGWHTAVLSGGYKAYRRWVIDQIETHSPRLNFRVVAGRTGSGKSRILQHLAAGGGQVLDLEALANHRGSVLGLLPAQSQPSQKQFESRLAAALAGFDPARIVYVESESRKIGKVQVPDALIKSMRRSDCVVVELPVAIRARFLISDYPHFLDNPSTLLDQLRRLLEIHGHAKVDYWANLIESQQWEDLVESLLTDHYDPAYDRSMNKNYRQLSDAPTVSWDSPPDDFDQGFALMARTIMQLPA